MVIADHCTMNVLIRAGLEQVLPELYGPVELPKQVYDVEAKHEATPTPVREFYESGTSWLGRCEASDERSTYYQQEYGLGRGEAEALAAAEASPERTLLTDDKRARQAALQEGLEAHGIADVFVRAEQQGLLDIETARSQLPSDFTLTDRQLDRARELYTRELQVERPQQPIERLEESATEMEAAQREQPIQELAHEVDKQEWEAAAKQMESSPALEQDIGSLELDTNSRELPTQETDQRAWQEAAKQLAAPPTQQQEAVEQQQEAVQPPPAPEIERER